MSARSAPFFRQVFLQFVAICATILGEFGTAWMVTNSLGVDDYGLLAFGYAFAILFHQVCDLRLTEAVIQFLPGHLAGQSSARASLFLKQIFSMEIGLRLTALITNLVAAKLAGPYFSSDPRTPQILYAFAFTQFFYFLVTNPGRGILRVLGHFDFQAVVAIVSCLFKIAGVALALNWMNGGLTEVAWAVTVATLPVPLFFAAAIWLVLTPVLGSPARRIWASPLESPDAPLRRFLSHNYLASLTMIPTRELDVTLLTAVSPLGVVGAYKLAKSFVGAFWTVADSIFFVVYPELSKLATAGHWNRLQSLLRKLSLLMLSAGTLLTGGAIFAFPWMLSLLFPSATPDVCRYFNILILSLPVGMTFVWLNPLVLVLGREDLFSRGSLFASLTTMLLYFQCVPLYRGEGAAWVTMASTPLAVAIILGYAWAAGVLRLPSDLEHRKCQ